MKGSIFFTFHIMSYFLYSKTAVHYLQTGKVTYLLSTCTHSLHFKKNSHLSVMSMRRVFHQFSHYLCFVWGSVLRGSVVSDSLPPHGPQPARLLCPWDFPGKDTAVGCHFLLQGIPWPRDRTWVSCVSCTEGEFFTAEPSGVGRSPLFGVIFMCRSCGFFF